MEFFKTNPYDLHIISNGWGREEHWTAFVTMAATYADLEEKVLDSLGHMQTSGNFRPQPMADFVKEDLLEIGVFFRALDL